MMDLSDGLSTDLPRMCAASGVGAEIYAEELPVFPQACEWDCDPIDLALHGGEDFELLFAVSNAKSRLFEKIYPSTLPGVTRIGRLTSQVGKIRLVENGKRSRSLANRGYDHFRPRSKDN
jgi:thiamine-monophosphate kinase